MKKNNKIAPKLLTRLGGENSIPTNEVIEERARENGFYTNINTDLIYGAPDWLALAEVLGVLDEDFVEGDNPFLDLLNEHATTELMIINYVQHIKHLKEEVKILREIILENEE